MRNDGSNVRQGNLEWIRQELWGKPNSQRYCVDQTMVPVNLGEAYQATPKNTKNRNTDKEQHDP